MNNPHIHLLLNHVPTIGTVIAFGLLVLSFIRRDEGLKRVSLEVFYIVAVLTLPAYISGVGTEFTFETNESISKEIMTRHHDAALLASIFMLLTGVTSWLSLWQWRRLSRFRNGSLATVVLLSAVTLVLMGRAANIGGEIRHPEILDPNVPAAAVSPPWLSASAIKDLVSGATWVWPTSEALHFIGLWLLFGILLIANLRLMGLMRAIPFSAVHRLLPWAALGLVLNTITGMGWVLAAANQYVENYSFFWKIGLLLLAQLNLLYITVFDGPWKVGANADSPVLQRAFAATAVGLWIGVMYFGRMLPFLGNAF
jgi:hypothetical protein